MNEYENPTPDEELPFEVDDAEAERRAAALRAGLTEFERAGAELPRRADGVIGFEMVAQAPAGADDARFWGCIVRWLRD